MIRLFTKNATGVAPDGRWYAGDVNALQDAAAAINDLTQTLGVGTIQLGETGLQFIRFGAGEARISGALRTDGIIRALGGLFAATYTTTARDAIPAGFRPYGLVITNTTTNRLEWNKGTDAVPNWQPLNPPLAADSVTSVEIATDAVGAAEIAAGAVGSSEIADGSVTAAELAPQTIDVKAGDYSLVTGDRFKAIRMDKATAAVLTVPTNATQAFAIGESVDVIQWGAGQITFTPAAGVTINGNPGLKSVGQYTMVTLLKMATDTWLAVGGLTP